MAVDLVWTVLTILAVLSLVPNAASLAQGVRLRGHVGRAMRLAFGAYLPPVVVILPVRGLDEGFDDNVRAILSQAYPRFRILVVADDPAEPAAVRAHDLAREFPRIPVTLILSEPATVPGKVNALRSALSHVSPEDEVVVFADSDIRPAPDWLRQLVQPLADSTVGVATGFRWYVPPRPSGVERGQRQCPVRSAARVCLGWFLRGASGRPSEIESRGPMEERVER